MISCMNRRSKWNEKHREVMCKIKDSCKVKKTKDWEKVI